MEKIMPNFIFIILNIIKKFNYRYKEAGYYLILYFLFKYVIRIVIFPFFNLAVIKM